MARLSYILKQLRIQNGLTQKELAQYLHVSQNAIFNWENDKREPSAEMIEQIASYFKVSPAYLMGWEKQGTFFDKSGTPIGYFYGPTLQSSNYELKLEDADKPDPNAALRRMTTYMSLLTEAGQNKAIEQIELLTKIPEYQKEIASKAPSPDDTSSAPDPEDTSIAHDPLEVMAAHDRIDVEITPEGRQHDIDLMNDDSKWE